MPEQDFPAGVFSFSELEKMEEMGRLQHEAMQTFGQFVGLGQNILHSGMPDAHVMFMSLLSEFQERMGSLKSEVGEELKKEATMVRSFSGADGLYWQGIVSNKFIDRENDIFMEKSHVDYVRAVDAGEFPMPYLYIWHIPKAVGRAEMVAYDERGFLVAAGNVYPQYAPLVKNLMESDDMGMSHGIWQHNVTRSKLNKSWIEKYRSHEVSLLPRWAAANLLTAFDGKED